MKLFKCSKAKKITIEPDTGTVSIYLEGDAGVLVISLPELLALNAKACSIVASNEELPENFIQDLQEKITLDSQNIL